uniref:hypothetical protein n=1 Tax=Neorhizobium sp. EC2-8 TaxID=3129230 RepID=UPI003100CD98
MEQLISADHLWYQGALRTGLAVELSGGVVKNVRPLSDNEVPDRNVHLLGPALTDLQVNGSGGVMLNSDPSVEAINQIVAVQRSRGTGWVMPTLITCEAERMRKAARAAIAAWGVDGFLGLHIEGPHLNVLRKGTHNPDLIRPMDDATLEILADLRAREIPVMLTLAPEVVSPT